MALTLKVVSKSVPEIGSLEIKESALFNNEEKMVNELKKAKVTISDVAKKAGVSKTTVSRILNGDYAHTKEETRDRILQVIKELDYRPNALAKGLKSMSTNVIGIILSNLKNPYWSSVLEGVEDTCHKLGYSLMICNSDEDPNKEKHYIEEFQRRQVDGIVINPTVRNMEMYEELVKSKYPFVVVNRKIPNLVVKNVVVDNNQGAFLAVNHLMDEGRKRIAVTAFNNPHVSTWKERVEGYKEVLLSRGYAKKDFRILLIDPVSDVKEVTMAFLRKNPDVDALFSTNNMISLQSMEAIRELHLKIPEDIALVSYDETAWAKHLEPPLTTIKQPGYDMGVKATQMLVDSIAGNNDEESETIILEPELIVRNSSISESYHRP
ncbi:DNA-binding LacI/PurR family transcriptional regulator [Pullulanibacillus pueri]|uniref:LacI family transcriptional regulator n=1 Tax=Pullulanibacillus pueri TaxID=1437324 RepID=A0A8J2ZWT2_9BACL|nr:LacI family DNA-binding transcriptional regulator [Pullulanibacillus pueri]MBM7682597.1 DNA-binding LacI/PurR family transcriptional regulator [Pullulanibacillus pueri]GGH82449.1 LacI family transcriptional regulator [Pullulanibacillus pueri]